MKTGIWRYGLIAATVLLTAAICATALAQADNLGGDKQERTMRPEGERRGDGPGGQRAMMRMMQPPAPVMIVEKTYLYILAGNVLYQFHCTPLEQINAVHLVPPPRPEGMRQRGGGQRGDRPRQNNN